MLSGGTSSEIGQRVSQATAAVIAVRRKLQNPRLTAHDALTTGDQSGPGDPGGLETADM